MKLVGIIIYLFLLFACSPMGSNNIILKDSVTGENLGACSSNEDDDKVIFQSLQGECDHIPKPSPFHHVTRQVNDGEVCCVLQIYVDHGNGEITPIGR